MFRERMQQAAAAFSIVEAEVVGLHFAMPSQVEVGPSMHSDSENEPVSPHSCCGDDFSDENQSAHSDWQTALLDEDLLARGRQYDAVNIRYSRQQLQGPQHRPAVRWQTESDGCKACHKPQHSVMSPNKSCLKQRPEGFTFWFSEAQSEYHPASQRSLQSCLKFIDGKQGTQTPFGRKRSRLSSLD